MTAAYRRRARVLLLAGLMMLGVAGILYAQETGTDTGRPPAESDRVTILELIWAGGPIGWLIIGGSLAAAPGRGSYAGRRSSSIRASIRPPSGKMIPRKVGR